MYRLWRMYRNLHGGKALTEFNIRKLQMLVKRGENSTLHTDLHKCMLCGKCLLVCPRGVDTRRMILSLLKYINNEKI